MPLKMWEELTLETARKATTTDRNRKWSRKSYKSIGPISSKSERLQYQENANFYLYKDKIKLKLVLLVLLGPFKFIH